MQSRRQTCVAFASARSEVEEAGDAVSIAMEFLGHIPGMPFKFNTNLVLKCHEKNKRDRLALAANTCLPAMGIYFSVPVNWKGNGIYSTTTVTSHHCLPCKS